MFVLLGLCLNMLFRLFKFFVMFLTFRTFATINPDKGEVNSGEQVTQPGQSFTTREIYTRFLQTGRVLGEMRNVSYDSDSNENVDFDSYDSTQEPDFDLTDVTDAKAVLTNTSAQRSEINRLSVLYSTGKISYDEFCHLANQQNPDMAAPMIKRYGELLRQSQPPA